MRIRDWIQALGLLVYSIIVAGQAVGQETKPLPIETTLNTVSFGGFSERSIDLSPDGKWLAYVVKRPERTKVLDPQAWDDSGVPFGVSEDDVWISNVESGKARNLTQGSGENWLPKWSPDGRYLAFLSDRDHSGQAKVWIWKKNSNELTRIADESVKSGQIEWTPDSRNILVTTIPPRRSKGLTEGGHHADKGEAASERSSILVYESHPNENSPAKQADPWSLDDYLCGLTLIDIERGSSRSIVSAERIATFRVSPNGSEVAYTIPKRFERPGAQQVLFDIAVASLSDRKSRLVASDVRLEYVGAEFSWSPDSTMLSYCSGGSEEMTHDCFIVDRERAAAPENVTHLKSTKGRYKSSIPLWGHEGSLFFIHEGAIWTTSLRQPVARELATVPQHSVRTILSMQLVRPFTVDQGKSTVVLAHDDVHKQDGFYKVDLERGQVSTLLEDGQCYSCGIDGAVVSVSGDGKSIAYFGQSAARDVDVWVADPGFRDSKQVTHLNASFSQYQMGASQLIDWLSDDGVRLQGALLLPSDYHKGEKYPLIVWVYGGGMGSNSLNRFGLYGDGPFNLQLFATRGYVVFFPDSPQHEGTPMLDLLKTVLPGINRVIELGIADPHRVGIIGHSNGGYSTLGLIVQTSRFRAAVDIDGMGNLIGQYGEMNKTGAAYGTSVEHEWDALGGSPWEFQHRYIENSPVFYLDRVTTPLLIIHGGGDDAVAPFLSDEVFVDLRRLGKEVVYARYEGEDHDPNYWTHANQVDFCHRILTWFDKYLKSGSDSAVHR